MSTPAERIRARRIELGMTQDELAKAVGYSSRATINKIESNANNVRQTMIVKLANALKVSPDYIMGWDDEVLDADDVAMLEALKKSQAQKIVGKVNLREARLVDAYRNADDLTKKMVEKILNI